MTSRLLGNMLLLFMAFPGSGKNEFILSLKVLTQSVQFGVQESEHMSPCPVTKLDKSAW